MSANRVVFAVKILALSTLFQHPRMTGSENADLEKEISSASLEGKGLLKEIEFQSFLSQEVS